MIDNFVLSFPKLDAQATIPARNKLKYDTVNLIRNENQAA